MTTDAELKVKPLSEVNNEIIIGTYKISESRPGYIWITRVHHADEGEGFEIAISKFEHFIAAFYKETM